MATATSTARRRACAAASRSRLEQYGAARLQGAEDGHPHGVGPVASRSTSSPRIPARRRRRRPARGRHPRTGIRTERPESARDPGEGPLVRFCSPAPTRGRRRRHRRARSGRACRALSTRLRVVRSPRRYPRDRSSSSRSRLPGTLATRPGTAGGSPRTASSECRGVVEVERASDRAGAPSGGAPGAARRTRSRPTATVRSARPRRRPPLQRRLGGGQTNARQERRGAGPRRCAVVRRASRRGRNTTARSGPATSEHRVGVGCFLGDLLDDVPVLDDPAAVDSPGVATAMPRSPGARCRLLCGDDEVAPGDGRAALLPVRRRWTPARRTRRRTACGRWLPSCPPRAVLARCARTYPLRTPAGAARRRSSSDGCEHSGRGQPDARAGPLLVVPEPVDTPRDRGEQLEHLRRGRARPGRAVQRRAGSRRPGGEPLADGPHGVVVVVLRACDAGRQVLPDPESPVSWNIHSRRAATGSSDSSARDSSSSASTLSSTTAARRSSRVGKFRYSVAFPTPARTAMASVGALIPSDSKHERAAVRIASRLRRASARIGPPGGGT